MQNNVTKSEIEQARRMDLLTYLKQYEPSELVKLSSGIYCTRAHDSLKISNGKWYWWSRNIGGHSALDYLVAAKGMGLVQAVRYINGLDGAAFIPVEEAIKPASVQKKQFILPAANENNDRVSRYLTARGIDAELLNHCFQNNLIYEDKAHHNCVFVGYDSRGQPRYATLRSSSFSSTFCRDVVNSEKQYTFRILDDQAESLYLFESAIDLLSYFSIRKMKLGQTPTMNAISLSGIYISGRDESYMPAAVQHYLVENPSIKRIAICFDNDGPGRKAASLLAESLDKNYDVDVKLPNDFKDYNDMLRSVCKTGHNIATRSNHRKMQATR